MDFAAVDGDSFDSGGINFAEAQATPDKVLDWTVEIQDFDGDIETATFKTGIDGSDDDTAVTF